MEKAKSLLILSAALLLVGCGPSTSSSSPSSSAEESESELTSSSEVSTPEESESPSSESTPEVVKSVAITTEVNEVFITKTLQIEAEVEGGTLAYSVEGEAASIDATGLLTAIAPGKVTVKAYLVEDETVSDTLEVTVLDTIVDTSVNPDSWNYEGVYSKEATLVNTANGYTTFKGVSGKDYMMKAEVVLANPDAGDTWSRVSLGHVNPETSSFHGMMLSPGPNFTAPKIVAMDIDAAGNVGWGAVTDRSQAWNFNGLNEIDWTKPIELTSVRRGGDYYYYVGDKLYYKESSFNDFDEIDTLPSLYAGQVTATFTKMEITTDVSAIDEYIAPTKDQAFYPTYDDYVSIGEDSSSITFTGANEGAPVNPKDVAAKSLGDGFYLPANKQSTVEFDFKVTAWGGTDAMPSLIFNINRWDSTPNESRAYLISEFGAGFTGWAISGDLNPGIGTGVQPYAGGVRIEVDHIYHVKAVRLMTDGGQDTQIVISDGDTVLLDYAHNWQDGYSGAVVGSFMSRNLDAEITNITLTVAE